MGDDLIRSQRIGYRDVQIGADEWKVVVAAIPYDDIGLALGLFQDCCVVYAGEDEIASRDMRIVLLTHLDHAVGGLELSERDKTLDKLADEIAVWLGLPQYCDLAALVAQTPR